MRTLAFDTATSATTVALSEDGGEILEARDDPPPGGRPAHVRRLMPLIAGVMAEAGVGWKEIDRLAVGIGPGTFTGLRIGIATARALAGATRIPVVGVSTLQSLAGNPPRAGEWHAGTILAVLDARRGEAFAASWRSEEVTDFESALLMPCALEPQHLAERASSLGPRILGVGDGAQKFRAALESSGVLIPEDRSELHRVTARGHCDLARRLRPTEPVEVVPEYLRLPDAELARRITVKQ